MGVQFWIDLQLHYDVEIETDALRGMLGKALRW